MAGACVASAAAGSIAPAGITTKASSSPRRIRSESSRAAAASDRRAGAGRRAPAPAGAGPACPGRRPAWRCTPWPPARSPDRARRCGRRPRTSAAWCRPAWPRTAAARSTAPMMTGTTKQADEERLGADRRAELGRRDDPDLPQVRTHGRGTPAGCLDLGRGDPDEDVVQRRPRDLELEDPRPGHEGGEQVLGIAPPPHLLEVPVVVDLLDPVQAVEGVHAGLGPQPDRVVAVDRLDLVERAVEDLAAPEDHEDPVAQPLGDRHVVRREDDGRPGLPQVEHRVLEDLGIDRVEPGERLVEDQELGAVEHRRDELDLLGHPLGEGLDLLVDPGRAAPSDRASGRSRGRARAAAPP